MCDAMTAISAAMSVGGMLMQQQAQEDAADRQQAAINASLEQQDAFSRQAEARALDNAGEYRPETRVQRFEEARQQAGDGLAQSLVKSREAAPTVSTPAGRLSEDFSTTQAKSAANQLEQAIKNARLMGNMRGASDMLTSEGITNADYASQLGAIASKAAGSARAAQPGIVMAGKPDGFLSGLGGLMSAVGMSGIQGAVGDEFKAAAGFGTKPFSEQTAMLRAQSRGIF